MSKIAELALALGNRPGLFLNVARAMGLQVICWRPGCPGIVHRTWPSMTLYEWDGSGDDPNRDLLLCGECGQEHTDQMQDQWDEYRAGLL